MVDVVRCIISYFGYHWLPLETTNLAGKIRNLKSKVSFESLYMS